MVQCILCSILYIAPGQLQSERGEEGEGEGQEGGSQDGASASQSASEQPQSLKCDE